jgi:hypothetical protein
LDICRRTLMQAGAAAGLVAMARPASANLLFAASPSASQINPALMARAKLALATHRSRIAYTDVIAITDFSRASRDPRFYLVDMNSGMINSFLVAHGRGSDPAHSGWLEHFSNERGSYASSSGTYLTNDIYQGKYGRSLRLMGLDATNSNALDRAIVVHSAWYAEPKVAEQTGKLGRSEGCFTLPEASLQYVLSQLGPGRMIYADKI